MAEHEHLERALDEFAAAAAPETTRGAVGPTGGGGFNPCETYQSVKGALDAIIALLTAGSIIPYASKIALVLTTLRTILNAVCKPAS